MDLSHRKKIPTTLVSDTVSQLQHRIYLKVKEFGNHAYASRHEILGQLQEEFAELTEAVQKDKSKDKIEIRSELMDIAVGCIWGVLSIDTKSIDW